MTNNSIGYRYLRYRAGGNCNIAEIEFYRGAKLAGTPFGSLGSWGNSGNDFRKVFDGDINTFFDYSTETGGYAGLDVESGTSIGRCVSSRMSKCGEVEFFVSRNRIYVTSGASIVVTNARGAVVVRKCFTGPGTVDLNALKPGIYVVSGAKNVNEIRRAMLMAR